MYILYSIITAIIGLWLEINLTAAGIVSEIPTIITIAIMGGFILYDNKRKQK